jgi:hypothetical protein
MFPEKNAPLFRLGRHFTVKWLLRVVREELLPSFFEKPLTNPNILPDFKSNTFWKQGDGYPLHSALKLWLSLYNTTYQPYNFAVSTGGTKCENPAVVGAQIRSLVNTKAQLFGSSVPQDKWTAEQLRGFKFGLPNFQATKCALSGDDCDGGKKAPDFWTGVHGEPGSKKTYKGKDLDLTDNTVSSSYPPVAFSLVYGTLLQAVKNDQRATPAWEGYVKAKISQSPPAGTFFTDLTFSEVVRLANLDGDCTRTTCVGSFIPLACKPFCGDKRVTGAALTVQNLNCPL